LWASRNGHTEIGPGGSGPHPFVSAPGADITRHREKDGFLEIHAEGRCFTVTGNARGGVKPIAKRTTESRAVHDKFPLPGPERSAVHAPPLPPASSVSGSEAERFLRAGLERDKLFAAPWDGERRNGNESGDDRAPPNKPACRRDADEAAMIGAFLSSPHFARKDEAHERECQRDDHPPNTERKAAAAVHSTAIADHERWGQSRKKERSRAR
jgi:hypothetical protein